MNKNVTKLTTGVAMLAGVVTFGGATIKAQAATNDNPISQPATKATDNQRKASAQANLSQAVTHQVIAQNGATQAEKHLNTAKEAVVTANNNLAIAKQKQVANQAKVTQAQKVLSQSTPEKLLTVTDNLNQAKKQANKDAATTEDLDTQLTAAKAAANSQKMTLKDTNIAVANAQQKFNQAQTDFNDKSSIAANNKLSLTELGQKIEQLQNEILQSQSLIDKNTPILHKFDAKIGIATSTLNQANTAHNEALKDLTIATKTQSDTKKAYDQAQKALDGAKQTPTTAKIAPDDLTALQTKLTNTKNAYDEAQKAVLADQKAVDDATTALSAAKDSLSSLNVKRQSYLIDGFQNDVTKNNHQLADLQKQQTEINNAQTAKDTFDAAEIELNTQQKNLTAAQKVLTDNVKQVDELKSRLTAAQELVNQDKSKITDLQNELDSYNNAGENLEIAKSEATTTDKAVDNAEQALKTATKSLEAAKADLEQKKSDLTVAEKEVKAAQEDSNTFSLAPSDNVKSPHETMSVTPNKPTLTNTTTKRISLTPSNGREIVLPKITKNVAPAPKVNVTKLPQTSESATPAVALFGSMIMGLTAALGLLGLRRKQQN